MNKRMCKCVKDYMIFMCGDIYDYQYWDNTDAYEIHYNKRQYVTHFYNTQNFEIFFVDLNDYRYEKLLELYE